MYKGALRECVLFALDEEGTWTVKMGDKDEIQKKTTIDDGSAIVSDMQQDAKMEKFKSAVHAGFKVKACMSLVDPKDVGQSDEEEKGHEDEDGASDHSSVMDESGDDDIAKIVSGCIATKPKAKSAGKAKAKAKPNGASSSSGAAAERGGTPKAKHTAKQQKLPEPKEFPEPLAMGERPPLDIDLYFARNGVTEVDQKMEDLCKAMSAHTAFQSSTGDLREISAAIKELSAQATAINKESVTVYWRIMKRKDLQQELVQALTSFRSRISAVSPFLQLFTVKNPEQILRFPVLMPSSRRWEGTMSCFRSGWHLSCSGLVHTLTSCIRSSMSSARFCRPSMRQQTE
jgi:hypothetical protein